MSQAIHLLGLFAFPYEDAHLKTYICQNKQICNIMQAENVECRKMVASVMTKQGTYHRDHESQFFMTSSCWFLPAPNIPTHI